VTLFASSIRQQDLSLYHRSSNLQKGQDQLHIKVYDEDVVGKDSIGSAKVSLKKIQQAGGQLDEWVKLPAHLGLGSHGEIHLVMRMS
jgi:Ca2+-dependent lipid-binding protein